MPSVNSDNNTVDGNKLEFGNPDHMRVMARAIEEQKELDEINAVNGEETDINYEEITYSKASCGNCDNESEMCDTEEEAREEIAIKVEGEYYCSECKYKLV